MNQILVSDKVYVTPELKKKKKFYKIQFILSIFLLVIFSSYYIFSEYDKRKDESVAKDILNNINFAQTDNTMSEDDILVVSLDETVEEVEVVEEIQEQHQNTQNNNVYVSNNGTKYTVDSILNIPSLGINYPVLSETSDELLKISLNKFWGGNPNTVGNYCVVGHNYDGKDIMFGKLNKIQNGDIVELQDQSGKTVQYKVYNKFVVEPTDVACTSQLTNGQVEMTLITCYNFGKQRLIVKCRAI